MEAQTNKQCSACTEVYSIEYFYVDKNRPDGRMNRCIACYKNKNKSVIKAPKKSMSKEARTASRKVSCFKYEKTLKGFLMRTYRNMKSRVTGIQKKKAHLYLGLPILDKAAFYSWALAANSYVELYLIWKTSDYDRKLTPSIDRIDASKGYVLGNMRWLTHSQNSSED